MYAKRILKFHILKRKELGLGYYLPIAVVFVLLPFLVVNQSRDATVFHIKTYEKILMTTQLLIPVCSVFWLLFQLDEWIDYKKKELYSFVYNNSIVVAVYYSFYFNLLLIPAYLFLEWRIAGFFYEYFRILCVCVFFQGAVLVVLTLAKTKWLAVLLVFLYILFSNYNRDNRLSYVADLPVERIIDYSRSAGFLLAGFSFTILLIWMKRVSKGFL